MCWLLQKERQEMQLEIKSTQENLKGLEVVLKEKDHEIANHENAVRAQLCTSI